MIVPSTNDYYGVTETIAIDETIVKGFTFVRQLGQGQHAVVLQATHESLWKSAPVAVRIEITRSKEERNRQQRMREVMESLKSSPFITTLYGFGSLIGMDLKVTNDVRIGGAHPIPEPGNGSISAQFIDTPGVCSEILVTPIYDGTVHSWIHNTRVKHDISDALPIIRSVAMGLEAIHRQNAVHRDIHAENVYVINDIRNKNHVLHAVIGDFGLSYNLNEYAGSRVLRAIAPPEMHTTGYTMAGDVYQFGIFVACCVLRKQVFGSDVKFCVFKLQDGVIEDVSRDLNRLRQHVSAGCLHDHPELLELFLRSVGKDPNNRPKMSEWVKSLLVSKTEADLFKDFATLSIFSGRLMLEIKEMQSTVVSHIEMGDELNRSCENHRSEVTALNAETMRLKGEIDRLRDENLKLKSRVFNLDRLSSKAKRISQTQQVQQIVDYSNNFRELCCRKVRIVHPNTLQAACVVLLAVLFLLWIRTPHTVVVDNLQVVPPPPDVVRPPMAEPITWNVFACGNNDRYQLAINDSATVSSPKAVDLLPLNHTFIQSSSGFGFTAFLSSEGTVWMIGDNDYGQLGTGGTEGHSILVSVHSLNDVIQVSACWDFTLYLLRSGSVLACGNNQFGQLGDGSNTDRTEPVHVLNLTDVKAVSCGMFHSLFLKHDGTVWVSGAVEFAETTPSRHVNRATQIHAVGETVTEIACGSWHSMCLHSNGSVYSFGANLNGQLGYATGEDESEFDHSWFKSTLLNPSYSMAQSAYNKLLNIEIFKASSEDVVQTEDMKNNTSSFFNFDGSFLDRISHFSLTLKFWSGGEETATHISDPSVHPEQLLAIPIFKVEIEDVVAISCGSSHSLFVTHNSTVFGSGSNKFGQLGQQFAGLNVKTPILISKKFDDIVQIAGGESHSLFLHRDGSVSSCGRNAAGELGDGTTSESIPRPRKIRKLPKIGSIQTGLDQSFFFRMKETS